MISNGVAELCVNETFKLKRPLPVISIGQPLISDYKTYITSLRFEMAIKFSDYIHRVPRSFWRTVMSLLRCSTNCNCVVHLSPLFNNRKLSIILLRFEVERRIASNTDRISWDIMVDKQNNLQIFCFVTVIQLDPSRCKMLTLACLSEIIPTL